ncbi:MAG TPA: hypothetical protein VLE46_00635 [Nitrospira sp.]|nr:hypothetical protein [Nitrospira sp.]
MHSTTIDNNVVQQDKLNQSARLEQIARGIVVASGWLRVAGWVVMYQHHCGVRQVQSFFDYASNLHRRLCRRTLRNILLAQPLILAVRKTATTISCLLPVKPGRKWSAMA